MVMNTKILLVGLLSLTSCAALSPTKTAYDYDVTPDSHVKDKMGVLTVTDLQRQQILFQFKNTGSSSAKINWDESAIVDTEGNSHRIMHNGVRIITAGEPMAPTTVPASASVSDAASLADGAQFIAGMWMLQDLMPCASSGAICDHQAQYGKTLTLLLKVNEGGKDHEYIAKIRLKKEATRETASVTNANY